MSPKIDAFVDRHGWQIIVFLVSAIVAWRTLESQVQNKAEKQDVLQAEQRLDVKIDSVARDVKALLYLTCQESKYRNDSVCEKK